MSLRQVGTRGTVTMCQHLLRQRPSLNADVKKFLKTESHTSETVRNEGMGLEQNMMANAMPGKGPPPQPPIYCCMEGCPDCVYIKYANDLIAYYANGGEKAKAEIEKHVQNPHIQDRVLTQVGLA